MENPSSKVADLVTLLHTNIDSIHACINSLSDTTSHDAELERLEQEREEKIAALRQQHDEAVKALADQRQKEAEELEAKRKQEQADLEEQRRIEYEELMARRRKEDEERKARMEAEEAERERLKKEEDERREKEKEESERTLAEKVEAELEKLEDEMERKVEEGKKALRDLDEKRKAINAQIDAALNTPTVIPEIRFRSRAKTLSRARADTVIDGGKKEEPASITEPAVKAKDVAAEPETKPEEEAPVEQKDGPSSEPEVQAPKADETPTSATSEEATPKEQGHSAELEANHTEAVEAESKDAHVEDPAKHDDVPALSESDPQTKEVSEEPASDFPKADDIPTEIKKDVDSEDHHDTAAENLTSDPVQHDAAPTIPQEIAPIEAKEESTGPESAESPAAASAQVEREEEHVPSAPDSVGKDGSEHVEGPTQSKDIEAKAPSSDKPAADEPSVQDEERHDSTPETVPETHQLEKPKEELATGREISPEESKDDLPAEQHTERPGGIDSHEHPSENTHTDNHTEQPKNEPVNEPEISHHEDEHPPANQHTEQPNGIDTHGTHQEEGESEHDDYAEPLNSATIQDALLEDKSLYPFDDDEPHLVSRDDDDHNSEHEDQDEPEDASQTNHFHEALKSEFADLSLRTPPLNVKENPIEDLKESEATVAQPEISKHESGADTAAVSGNELPDVQSDRGADADVRDDVGQSVGEGEHEVEVKNKLTDEILSHSLEDYVSEEHHEHLAEEAFEPAHGKEEPQQVSEIVESEPPYLHIEPSSDDTISRDVNEAEEPGKHDQGPNKEHGHDDDARVTPSEVRQAYFGSGTSLSMDPPASDAPHVAEEAVSNDTPAKNIEEPDAAASESHIEATPEPESHEEPVTVSSSAPLSLSTGQDISRMATPEPPREGLGEASSTLAVAPETPTSGHFAPHAELVESSKGEPEVNASGSAENESPKDFPTLNVPGHDPDSAPENVPSSQERGGSFPETPADHHPEDRHDDGQHLGEHLIDDHEISHLDLDHGPTSTAESESPNHDEQPQESHLTAPSTQGQERNLSADGTPLEAPLSTSDEFFTPMVGGSQESESSQYPLPDQSRSHEPTPTFPKESAVENDEPSNTHSDEGLPQTRGSITPPEPEQDHPDVQLSIDPVSHTVVPKHVIEALDDAGVNGPGSLEAQDYEISAEHEADTSHLDDSHLEDNHGDNSHLESSQRGDMSHDQEAIEKQAHVHEPLDTSGTFADHQDISQPMTAASSRADTFVSAEEGQDSDREHEHEHERNHDRIRDWPLPTDTLANRDIGLDAANQPTIQTDDPERDPSDHALHEKPIPSPLGLGAVTMHHSKEVDREDSPGPQPAVDPTHEDEHQQAISNVAAEPGFTPSERPEPEFEQYAVRPQTPVQAQSFADQPQTPVQVHPYFSEHHAESPVTVLNADDLFDDDSDEEEESDGSFPLGQYQDESPVKSSEERSSEPENESQTEDIADEYLPEPPLDAVPEHAPLHRFSESPHRNSGLFANLVDTIRPDIGLVRQMSDHQADEEEHSEPASTRPVSVSFDESAGSYDYAPRDDSLHVRSHTADTVPSFESYAHSDTPTSPSETASSPFQETPHDEPRIQSSWQEDAPIHDEHQDLKPQASPLQADFDPFNSTANPNYVTPKTSQANLRETEYDPYDYSGGVDAPKLPEKDARRSSLTPSPLGRQFPASPSPSRRQFPTSPSRSPGFPTLNTSSASQFSEGRPYDSPVSRTNSMHEDLSEQPSSSPFPSPSSLARRTTGPSPPKIASSRTPVSSPSIPSNSFFQKTRSLFESASTSPTPSPTPPPARPLSGFFSVGRSPPPPPPPRKTSRPSSLYQSESAMAEYNEEEDGEFIVRNLDGDGKPPSPVFIPSRESSNTPSSHANSLAPAASLPSVNPSQEMRTKVASMETAGEGPAPPGRRLRRSKRGRSVKRRVRKPGFEMSLEMIVEEDEEEPVVFEGEMMEGEVVTKVSNIVRTGFSANAWKLDDEYAVKAGPTRVTNIVRVGFDEDAWKLDNPKDDWKPKAKFEFKDAWLWVEGWRARLRAGGDLVEKCKYGYEG
ncbi:uncharacterized protein PAC_17729 [Phialocephala subalpina]|uniref:Uncharacterized protein n=1 Tax=Phialocephala subalpina TaxID=576137 RepID=A0A1L7XS26_9HELO|nr:uncharacterized protein PAC_17729 [Phialocephala subalpina]